MTDQSGCLSPIFVVELDKEWCMWMVVGTSKDVNQHRLSDEAIKKLLETGEGPWEEGSVIGADIYWGKLAFRCTNDVARCTEELPSLKMQKSRLHRWTTRTMVAAERRMLIVGKESGKGILLGRWIKLLQGITYDLKESDMKWPIH